MMQQDLMKVNMNFNDVLQNQISQMNTSLRSYVSSSEFEEMLDMLAQRYELDPEETSVFKTEFYLFTLGLVTSEDFFTEILLETHLEEGGVEELLSEATTELIEPVSDLISEFWAEQMVKNAEKYGLDNTPTPPTPKSSPPSEPLSTPRVQPQKQQRVTDTDIQEARKALKDPYREPIE